MFKNEKNMYVIEDKITFFDFEVGNEKILDIGAVNCRGDEFHSGSTNYSRTNLTIH